MTRDIVYSFSGRALPLLPRAAGSPDSSAVDTALFTLRTPAGFQSTASFEMISFVEVC